MYDLVKEFLMKYITITLIIVMIIAGVLGGLINFYLVTGDTAAEGDKGKNSLRKSLLLGVGAAFLVPLFLNMISSNLLELSKQDASKLLVFAGFCLIASISSKAFISTLSDRILSEAKTARREASEAKKEVEKVQPKVDALTAKETESFPSSNEEMMAAAKTPITLGKNEKEVLEALGNPKYTFRFRAGIANEKNIPLGEMDSILSELIEKKGLVARTLGRNNRELLYLTENGRSALAQSSGESQTTPSN
jgi:uncharacterized membrane protein